MKRRGLTEPQVAGTVVSAGVAALLVEGREQVPSSWGAAPVFVLMG